MNNWCACGVLINTKLEYHYTDYHECTYHNYESCGLCSHMTETLVGMIEGYLWAEANQ